LQLLHSFPSFFLIASSLAALALFTRSPDAAVIAIVLRHHIAITIAIANFTFGLGNRRYGDAPDSRDTALFASAVDQTGHDHFR
jgi:hypothetical protein